MNFFLHHKTTNKKTTRASAIVLFILFLLIILLPACSWKGPEKKWENPVDIGRIPPPCTPKINNVAYPEETLVNRECSLHVDATCDSFSIDKYAWSFDSGTTWDTTAASTISHSWGINDTGSRTVCIFVIDSYGTVSQKSNIHVNVTAGRPLIVHSIKDTTVSQHTCLQKAFLADDLDGTITMYYWSTADEGWSDSADLSTHAIATLKKPEGGKLQVRWGAMDNDGLMTIDTFVVNFNRGPQSVILTRPSPEKTSVFDSYSILENKGAITCSFYAADPDSSDSITYTFLVKNGSGDTVLSYHGNDTSATIRAIEASAILFWSLKATDAFGDSIGTSGEFITPRSPSTTDGMVLIPGGAANAFRMGQSGFDSSEQPIHTVMFSYSFLIDSTEITMASYNKIMKDEGTTGISMLPVSNVTWFEAALYCNARSKKHGFDTVYSYDSSKTSDGMITGLYGLKTDCTIAGFRLPTEAEWEYACKKDSLTLFFWGNDATIASTYSWTRENSGDTLHPVASKYPSGNKLYDMAGNVWEWCNDWFDPSSYSDVSVTDPTGPAEGTQKVLRGGSFRHSLYFAQSATRSKLDPANANITVGFRTVLLIK